MIRLTLYSRPGCHLCDEMKVVIARVSTRIPVELVEVDISRDGNLERLYGSEIPVLEAAGRKLAKYRITERELETVLRARR